MPIEREILESSESGGAAAVHRLPVAILLSSRPAMLGRWQHQKNELLAIAPRAPDDGGEEIAESGGDMTMWRGLALELRKESAESYWANVSGGAPKVFVACRGEDGGVRPVCITASGEEAAGFGEVDDEILCAPMPAWMTEHVERFVVAHYRPQPKKVRRRA